MTYREMVVTSVTGGAGGCPRRAYRARFAALGLLCS
jgi:hypothetical protein